MLNSLSYFRHLMALATVLLLSTTPCWALDTDIYQANVKQNCYILLDASGSMAFGVYESNVDYGAMYDYLLTLNEDTDPDDSYTSSTYTGYIYDKVRKDYLESWAEANKAYLTADQYNSLMNYYLNYYKQHEVKNRIYLVPGDIGITAMTKDGETLLFTGDAADPDYIWYSDHLIDTYTDIDSSGNLVAAFPDDPDREPLLTIDADGYILYNNKRLPNSQDILYRHSQQLYGGGKIEDGFGDLLNAPGYYFSGKTAQLDEVSKIPEEDSNGKLIPIDAKGDEEIAFFFITGNWMNMQQVYNLRYITNNPVPQGAGTGDAAWEFEHFPLADNAWPLMDYDLDYPEGDALYGPNLDYRQSITHQGAQQIRIRIPRTITIMDNATNTEQTIDVFDVNATEIAGINKNRPGDPADWLIITDAAGNEVARYNNSNEPPADGWSPVINGDTAIVRLVTGSDNHGTGFIVDQYAYNDDSDGYLMKNRLGVATSSILRTIEEFRGKINWGTFTFPVPNGSDGAVSHQVINPNLNDDENRENISADFKNVTAGGGTPIGEALQEVFEVGYYQHRSSIDNLLCRKNYAIVLSDGFPSTDDNWGLIGDITGDPHLPFEDWDGDGFTADPYQYASPPPNYYDDVAEWMYNHSWLDKTEVADPAQSYVNVSTHHVSFGFQNPLMENAAAQSGGMFITAYNEGQLNAAFYALALSISEAVSFTAPVVSVDEANKIQHGDDLYMGQFLPMDSQYWPGNLKKYKLGDGSDERPDIWQIYDGSNNEATDLYGRFLDNRDGFWGDENDDNDLDEFGGPDIREDGVGEVLTERVEANFTSGSYTDRNIKTVIGGSLVDFNRDNVDPDHLGLDSSDTLTRDKVINWIYGYTFDADPTTGDPIATRDWALGAIVHSRPTVVDYYDASDHAIITKRYITVCANDGMLHVFDDTDGSEVFAFIPPDVLTRLPQLETEFDLTLVDGSTKLFRRDAQPKYLFFGMRRGGYSYWKLDITDSNPNTWTVSQFTDSELGQSWSDLEIVKIRTGASTYTDVAIFSGGYDPTEDNYPEPFNDLDNNGTPYASNGNLDANEWKSSVATQDINNNGQYDIANPGTDSMGRALYVVDVDTLSTLFSVRYDETTNSPSTLGTYSSTTQQTRTDMKFCFPATPTVAPISQDYTYIDGGGVTVTDRMYNVLFAIYAPDIYGNLFRINYDYSNGSKLWQVKKIFSANPASTNESSELRQGTDSSDGGRKVFYGPAVSWQGAGRYFDPENYNYPGTTFSNHNRITSLFFGTGDREHPSYQLVRNRFYALYDDSLVSANNGSGSVAVSTAPYTENDLLNLTCDELGINTVQSSMTAAQTLAFKTNLMNVLTDDVLNIDYDDAMELDGAGSGENDAKGWYIILEDQGDSIYCAHCDYAGTVSDTEGGRDYHAGEKILSQVTLFNKILYFTSYQPAYDDPCAPEGNAFVYALNYIDGSAALNLNVLNDDSSSDDPIKKDVTDRYGKHSGVKGIPSNVEVIIRGDEAGGLTSIGGSVVGPGGPGKGYQIPTPDLGLNLYYWIER